jgi:hypothetical protein
MSGNGIAAMTFLPAFTGVTTDVFANPLSSSSINVGAVQ